MKINDPVRMRRQKNKEGKTYALLRWMPTPVAGDG